MKKNSKILVLGHTGLIGSSIIKELKNQEYTEIRTLSKSISNLCDYKSTLAAFKWHSPDYIINAAGKNGGIYAKDNNAADFIRENLQISINVIEAARQTTSVKKLLYIASSSIYSKNFIFPINEDQFLTGLLDDNDIGYSISKIAGIKMCQLYNKQYGCNFISVIPSNVYGENDNFDLINSSVIPGMIAKFELAKMNKDSTVTLWGDGSPIRDFIYVKDFAKAIIFLMNNYDSPEIINVGSGTSTSIKELSILIKNVIQYNGSIEWNDNFKNECQNKVLNVKKINNLGWKYETKLSNGIKNTYDWFINNYYTLRKK